jgi:general secretion pathway protein E
MREAVLKDLQTRTYTPKLFIASRSGIEEAWRNYAGVGKSAHEITGEVDIGAQGGIGDLAKKLTTLTSVREEFQKRDFTKSTTSATIEVVLAGALAVKASDVHFETEEGNVRVRYRMDGVLHDALDTLPPKTYQNVISRIKLVAGMKINIHSEAQDGRFTIKVGGKEIEMRVSIIPSEFGETIVMRILDPDAISVEMPKLGLRPDDLAIWRRNSRSRTASF